MNPTAEQSACIDAMATHNVLKISAVAGGGKTSSLRLLAESNTDKSLYLAFNKVTAEEAAEKFPKHVECRTTHSLAYAAVGAKMSKKLSRPPGKYVNVAGTGSEIARHFKIGSYEIDSITIPSNFLGLMVKETLARFEQSADEEVEAKHVYSSELNSKLCNHQPSKKKIEKEVLKFAKKLWKQRIDISSNVLATHDTYLKLYQLSKPKFSDVSIVYVDESQDSTPCVMDIINNQAETTKLVLVGDARQAIYGWRGAVNAMAMVECEERKLTKSFRYGQAIADVATIVLERDMIITGNEAIKSVVGLSDVVDRTKPYTRLFRTNSALVAAALEAKVLGIDISIEIDVKDFVKLLQSAQALYSGDKRGVKHDKVLSCNSWDDAIFEGKHDAELGRIVKAVNEGKAQRWIEILEGHVNSDEPHITFTTAHKSKGREFEQVIVESDFKSCYNEGEWVGLTTEEQNLLYVALTRAILRLEYNMTVQEYITREMSEVA